MPALLQPALLARWTQLVSPCPENLALLLERCGLHDVQVLAATGLMLRGHQQTSLDAALSQCLQLTQQPQLLMQLPPRPCQQPRCHLQRFASWRMQWQLVQQLLGCLHLQQAQLQQFRHLRLLVQLAQAQQQRWLRSLLPQALLLPGCVQPQHAAPRMRPVMPHALHQPCTLVDHWSAIGESLRNTACQMQTAHHRQLHRDWVVTLTLCLIARPSAERGLMMHAMVAWLLPLDAAFLRLLARSPAVQEVLHKC